MNRAARRQQERARRKHAVLVAGDGVIATSLGHKYEGVPHAELPPKQRGRHRWVACASWVLSDEQLGNLDDPDRLKFLDQENLMSLGIGCWDCERSLGEIPADSNCPGSVDDGS